MLKSFGVLALIGVTVTCGALTYSVLTLSHASGLALTKIDAELDELHRLTLEVGLTAMEARNASVKESRYLDTWNAQIASVLTATENTLQAASTTIAGLNGVSDAAVSTLKTTQQSVASIQAPMASANQALTAATGSINDLDALLKNPALSETITHTDATMAHVDATTGEVQKAVHSYFHPTWPQRILGWIKDGAVTAGSIFY